MLKLIIIVIMFFVSFSQLSCSTGGSEEISSVAEKENPEIATSEEAGSKESPVFTYEEAKNPVERIPEIYIILNNDPVEIPGKGFVKFKGAIIDRPSIALLEVGGKGVIVRWGDMIGQYVVDQINGNHVRVALEADSDH